MSKFHIGISGWTFPGWRKKFYPKDLVQKQELAYASRQVSTIEINGTFYGLQKPASFQNWYDQTPDDFIFAVKASQYITHIRRLKEVVEPLATFLGSGLLCLKQKLGPILWQFPPNFMLKDERVEKFLEMLPHDAMAAAKLAKEHGYKMEGRHFFDVKDNFRIRHAFEFRHQSFNDPKFVKLLKKHKVAFVMAHTGVPYVEEITADFIYARMHGEGPEFKKGYPPKVIKEWATKLKRWSTNKKLKDFFIYFDTEKKVYAPSDAKNLTKLLVKN